MDLRSQYTEKEVINYEALHRKVNIRSFAVSNYRFVIWRTYTVSERVKRNQPSAQSYQLGRTNCYTEISRRKVGSCVSQ